MKASAPNNLGLSEDLTKSRHVHAHTTGGSQHSLYLGTQMEVTEQDGGLRAGDDEDDEDEEQEAKHIVHLMGPASREEFFLSVTCRTAVTTGNHLVLFTFFRKTFTLLQNH